MQTSLAFKKQSLATAAFVVFFSIRQIFNFIEQTSAYESYLLFEVLIWFFQREVKYRYSNYYMKKGKVSKYFLFNTSPSIKFRII